MAEIEQPPKATPKSNLKASLETSMLNGVKKHFAYPIAGDIACYEDCQDLLDQCVNLLEMLQCVNVQGSVNSGAQHGVYLTLANVIESLQLLGTGLETLQYKREESELPTMP